VWLWATDQAGALDVRLEDLCDPDEAETPASLVDWDQAGSTRDHIYVVAAARHGAAGSAVLPRVPSETSGIPPAWADLGGVDSMTFWQQVMSGFSDGISWAEWAVIGAIVALGISLSRFAVPDTWKDDE
jgi:hypothetical protein